MKSITTAFLSLVFCVATQAQTPPKPVAPATKPIPAPVVPKAPVVPAKPPIPGAPAAAPRVKPVNQGVPAQGAKRRVDPNALAVAANGVIDGSNWDDQDVADAYTSYTGKRVLLSSSTQSMEIRFFQRGPLTNAEAARLLDKVLNMEGFAFVPSGVNEVKLLPKAQSTGADAPGDTEIMVADPNDIPKGDEYISYFMKLSFIKPDEAVRTFTQSIHGLGPGAKIAPVTNASAVIITGKSSFIRKLVNQKQYIDVSAGTVSTTWVSMKYADAEEVATTLNEIMNSQQQRKTTAGVTTGKVAKRATPPGIPVSGRTGTAPSSNGSSAAGEDIPVQIVANPRLNKIFIMGRPVDIVFVESLAREFDAPPNRNNFIKRRLRFMIARDFLDVASDALDSVGGTIGGTQQGGAGGGRQTANRNQNRNTGGNTGRQTGGGTGSGAAGAESVQEFDVSDVPESRVIGKTLLVADNIANSILVQGPPESIRIVSELIDKLDGRPQQVMISTVFGQVSLGKDKDVGVSLGRVSKGADGNGDSRDGAGSSNFAGTLQDLAGLGDIAGLNTAAGTAAGLNVYGRVKNITGVIRALESRTDFKVLSRPTVYTSNNRRAVISSGRRIAVPTNTFTSGGTGTASQSTNIEYRDVLLRFEVVPLINSDDEVTLRISLLNEDTQGTQEIDGNLIPTIVTESLATTVTVYNNTTVVLGGLVTESENNTTTGVPVLSRIPALGRLFRRDVKDVNRRELLIFIQPKIINGDSSQRAAQGDMEARYKGASTTRDFADGVLPGKAKTKTAAPSKAPASSKKTIPTASKRPGLRYPTRR